MVVISLWDDVFGPKYDQLYYIGTAPDDGFVQTVAKDTLAGTLEVDYQTKLIVHPSGSFFSSIIFTAPYFGHMTRFSVSVVADEQYLEFYMDRQTEIEDRMF